MVLGWENHFVYNLKETSTELLSRLRLGIFWPIHYCPLHHHHPHQYRYRIPLPAVFFLYAGQKSSRHCLGAYLYEQHDFPLAGEKPGI